MLRFLKTNLVILLYIYSLFSPATALSAVKYDSGANPVIARNGNVIVELHNSAILFRLWYRVGILNGNTIEWGKSYRYAHGYAPKIAMEGNTIVTTYREYDRLYQVGTVDPEAKTISWGEPHPFAYGVSSIAIYNDSVLEVHARRIPGDSDDEFRTTLVYSFGTVDLNSKTIRWSAPVEYGERSLSPSITIEGDTVLEVHMEQSGPVESKLCSRIGTIKGERIEWGPSKQYGVGTNPHISMAGNSIVEMHSSAYFDRLWYHLGSLNKETQEISWGPSIEYNRGLYPSIALAQDCLIEVHQSDYSSRLFYNIGTLNRENQMIQWNDEG